MARFVKLGKYEFKFGHYDSGDWGPGQHYALEIYGPGKFYRMFSFSYSNY